MLNSLYLYAKYFSGTVFSPRAKYLFKDLYRYSLKSNRFYRDIHPDERQRKLAIGRAIQWLLTAQKATNDNGIGSYHLVNKWSSSYPETTGYIIPSLLHYASANNDDNIRDAALLAADWLVGIQHPHGGWQGGRVNENRPPIVFNTAQIIRGLIAAYKLSRKQQYLDGAVKAGDWLCNIQEDDGTWVKHALMDRARVYDSYVDFPLLMLHRETRVEKYIHHAKRNLDWIVEKRQHDNGWFEDCDNTIKRNHKPILHTIAYTIDGLLDAGIYLDERRYVESARKPAEVLKEKFERDGFLHGRYDMDWKGSEHMILTGCAQMSIVWQKMAHYSGNRTYADTARNMNSLLINLQMRGFRNENKNTRGAVNGSYPLWGRYEPFAYPNWATKYFADALMMEKPK
jgi:uncharacterized protein YyaL (SSP411 family)